MAYSVRNVKQFRGREGHGFNATLYRDNVKVALVMDAANGGEYRFEWVDYRRGKTVRVHPDPYKETKCVSLNQA